jgi:hypothetical protein
VVQTEDFMPSQDQALLLDQRLLNAGFANTWLGQPYPAFAKPDYILLPFAGLNSSPVADVSTNWTGTTTKLTTELECWPANIAVSGPPSRGTFDFDNGRGCNASEVVPYNSRVGTYPWRLLYIGYHNSPQVDYFLKGSTCSQNSSNQFLAIHSAFVQVEKTNVSAIYCEASYFKQEVTATVVGPSRIPDDASIVPLGPREDLPETDFNTTAFHYLLASGVSEVTTPRDWDGHHLMDQFARLFDTGLSWPASSMVGYAIGTDPERHVSEYSDPEKLAQIFRTSHKMLFSLAVNHVLTDKPISTSSPGALRYEMHGFKVSRLFSAVVEGLLLIVSASALALLWRVSTMECRLSAEPGSVHALIKIIQNSPRLLDTFMGKSDWTDEALAEKFRSRRFELLCGCLSDSGTMTIKMRSESNEDDEDLIIPFPSVTGHYTPIRPLALQRGVGIPFLLGIAAMLAGLGYLKAQERALGGKLIVIQSKPSADREPGLIRPSESFEVLQLLQSFIPTVLATMIEPFWVLINRLLCLLQPFKDLFYGGKPASGSIDTQYTSIPPQLVVWRALKARHWLLVCVCIISLLCDVLAVGLGGLFNEGPVRPAYPVELRYDAAPRFNNDSLSVLDSMVAVPFAYEEHFYVTSANLTLNTPLPPWISTEYYFQPFSSSDKNGDNTTEVFEGRTRGFGIQPSCEAAEPAAEPSTVDLKAFLNRHGIFDQPNCTATYQKNFLLLNQSTAPPHGQSAVNFADTLFFARKSDPCAKVFLMAWGRTSEGNNENGTVDNTFVVCYPRFRSAMFDVMVDAAGRILSYVQAGEFEPDLAYPGGKAHADNLVIMSNNLLTAEQDTRWYNDTLSRNWLSHMIKLQTNSSDFLDPALPPPQPRDMIPLIEPMYQRFFALFLGLNSYIFENDTSSEPTFEGTRWTHETRIFMSDAAFVVSVTILGLSLLVAIWLYGWAVTFFLPRMPTNIASLVAYVAPSRLVRDLTTGYDRGHTYSFGRYVGDDGRAHVGIEMDPFVVPIQLKSLQRGNTAPKEGGWFGKAVMRKRRGGRKGDTWV